MFDDPREAGVVDVVMFAVKLWDTEGAAAADQADRRQATPSVIPFQNGVESIERLREVAA